MLSNCFKKIRMLLDDNIKNMIIYILLFLLVIVASILKLSNLTMIFSIVASVLLLYNVKKIVNNYISIAFIFTAFHVLYGLAGPVSVVWLNGLTATYGNVFNIFPYMIAYSLSSIFYYVGFYLFSQKEAKKQKEHSDINEVTDLSKVDEYRKYFLFVAICGIIMVLIFELINFIRVGGMPTVLRGKAIYQALVDELRFTLPSSELVQVSIASLCIYIFVSLKKGLSISKRTILFLLIIMLPYFILLVFLGKRGNILTIILMLLLAIFQYKPMNRLTKKFIIASIGLYFVLGSMFAVREYTGLMFKDFGLFTSKVFAKDNLVSAFNPGQNEFGCTFGNFNKLYISDDYEFLYGDSYIKGITHFIPSYFYPGTKPQLLMYKFRDRYFPYKAQISSIAGTAFSSILEAYWNFWYFGLIIYLLYGFVIAYLEFVIKKKSMFNFLLYISLVSYAYEFHRSDFGHMSFQFILIGFMVGFVYLFYRYLYKRNKYVYKLVNTLMRPNIIVLGMMNRQMFNCMPDKMYLKCRYYAQFGKRLNLNNPQTFNEKLQWLKLYNRKDIYTTMVDKFEAKEYIKNIIGKEYVIPTLGVYNSFEEIDFDKLPRQFVIKCTHDSGGLIVVKDKSKLDFKKAKKKLDKCLKHNYYLSGREWPYKNVKPRIIIEKLLKNKNNSDLIEYNFFCFNGEPKIFMLCHGEKSIKRYDDFYDIDFNKLDVKCNYDYSDKVFEKPKQYEKMVEMAKILSKDIPYLRVDFYMIDEKIKMGELTFFHWSGFGVFEPEEWDKKFGDMLDLSLVKKDEK